MICWSGRKVKCASIDKRDPRPRPRWNRIGSKVAPELRTFILVCFGPIKILRATLSSRLESHQPLVRLAQNSARELLFRPRRRSEKRTAASWFFFYFASSIFLSLSLSRSHSLSRNKRTQPQYNPTASIYQFLFIYIYIYIIYFFSHIYIHFVFYINNSVLDAFFVHLRLRYVI